MRLRRSSPSGPGLTRVRRGRGFTYRDGEGTTVTDAVVLARIADLVVPPAWTDVWLCPWPNGQIQAVGTDAAGRRQYLYHPDWRRRMDRIKYDRALDLAQVLPGARRSATLDLRRDDLSRERALAAAFRMLDVANLRVGSERYARSHGSFGLSTLLCAHASVSGDVVRLRFPAKSGQEWSSEVTDPDLAAYVARLKRRGGRARLLAWRAEPGSGSGTSSGTNAWHPLSAAEINDDLRSRTGGELTAKDFRTWHGTVAAAVDLARSGPQENLRRRQRAVAQAVRAAADALGNTPAIARASYIDPRLLDRYDEGRTIDPARLASAESATLDLLGRTST